jgi:hypothetical protein
MILNYFLIDAYILKDVVCSVIRHVFCVLKYNEKTNMHFNELLNHYSYIFVLE